MNSDEEVQVNENELNAANVTKYQAAGDIVNRKTFLI